MCLVSYQSAASKTLIFVIRLTSASKPPVKSVLSISVVHQAAASGLAGVDDALSDRTVDALPD